MKECYAGTIGEFEKWFEENADREDSVRLISYKKHTGKPSLSHRDSMEVAICFGWIDTIIKRIDEDRFSRTFVKRKPNAGWSNNTLSYAKRLVEEGRMRPAGLAAYELGKKKKTIDHGRPKNPGVPDIPGDLNKSLVENNLLDKFVGLSPSQKRYTIYWVDSGKRQETRDKRIALIIEKIKKGERLL